MANEGEKLFSQETYGVKNFEIGTLKLISAFFVKNKFCLPT